MAWERKWTVFAVLVSVAVVMAVVVPICVFQRRTGQQSASLSDGGAMPPSNLFLQFAAMIKCTTKTNPLQYQGYGCYCGFLNGEGTPVDETDRCCQAHDMCLDNLQATGVCPKGSFLLPYAAKIKGCGKNKVAKITCKPRQKYSGWERVASMGATECAEKLCKCDLEAATCFSRHQLNEQFKSRNKNRTLCSAPPTTPAITAAPGGTPTKLPTEGPQPFFRFQ
ncbi:phospholipase A2 A2-actitoxin-Cgg2a-like [Diadema setosum]|uniref:phospholipase A2 A2-actitoxin-Cgg2a-like n=1 Tax=Diadema setosum TaxID=31175 RepID=UPI003B3BABDF